MKKVLFIIPLLLLAFFVFVFLNNQPKYGGTLIFGRGGDSTLLDPALVTDGESFYATRQIYDTLVSFEYGTTNITPSLATSWDVSDDGLEYTFHLREGVKFAPTKYYKKSPEFTSKDVVFSLKRQFDSNEPYYHIGKTFRYWQSMDMSDIVKDVIALDKYSVKIILKKQESPFIANLAMQFVSILSKDYADFLQKNKTPELLSTKPVGTGAFIFESWTKGDKIVFRANENYWNGRPYVDTLVFKVIPNNFLRVAQLENKQVHIIDIPSPKEVVKLEKNSDIKIIKQAGLNLSWLAFNNEKKPFDNLLVRRALRHAINTKAIVDLVYQGFGIVATNPIPPTLWSYNKNLKGYEYSPKKAKELLAKAGYPKGFETNLWAMSIPRPYNPNAQKMAKAIQADLAKVGVRAKIVSYDWKTYLQKASMGEHDMLLIGWTGNNGDPDNFLHAVFSKDAAKKPAQNRAFWKNDTFSTLVDEAKTTNDIQKRTELYERAQEVFEEEAPVHPIAHAIVAEAMLQNVMGFKLEPTGDHYFKHVWLK